MSVKELIDVLLFGLFVLIPGQSRADRLDVLETYPPVEYCKQVTGMFYSGALSKVDGFARQIKAADALIIELIEHHQPLPRSAIWATQWDDLNDREKEFMTKHVFAGYDAGAKDQDEAALISQHFFESCVRYRVAETRI